LVTVIEKLLCIFGNTSQKMEITIKNSETSKTILEESKVKWKFFMRRTMWAIIIPFAGGISFLIPEFTGTNQMTTKTNGNAIIYDYHIDLAIGVGFIMLAALYSFNLLISKISFFDRAHILSNKHKLFSDESILYVTDECIKYEDFELKQEIKWSFFSHYKLYKNYLFLIIIETPLSAFLIDRRLLSEKDFSELLAFVRTRLVKK